METSLMAITIKRNQMYTLILIFNSNLMTYMSEILSFYLIKNFKSQYHLYFNISYLNYYNCLLMTISFAIISKLLLNPSFFYFFLSI